MNKCGLANLGNTCFLNACIQVLNCIQEIDQSQPTFSPHADPKKPETAVLSEWIRLKREMREKQSPVISPNRFIHSVHHIARIKGRDIFTGFAQNDMPEFLHFMIECMHNSVCRGVNMRISGKSENSIDDLAISCYKMLRDTYTREYSEIMDIFYGIYVSQITDSLNTTVHSLKPESFFTLDLPLNTNKDTQTIYECFDQFVETDILSGENAWFNEKTREKESVNKQFIFWNFPKILVIVFKRFSSDGTCKNNAFIDFPMDRLDLSKYVMGYNPKSYVYDLFGVCNHMGNIDGGHYTSFCRDSTTGEWVHCNDTRVDPISSSQIVTPAAYCLFYRKKNKSL